MTCEQFHPGENHQMKSNELPHSNQTSSRCKICGDRKEVQKPNLCLTDGCQRGEGEKGEKIEKLQNSHGDVKESIGDIDNNIVITMYGARRIPEILGEHFVKYIIV